MHPQNVAARYAYVQLYHNDQFQGLYILMERLDAKRLHLSSSGMLFKDPPVFHLPEQVPDPENYFHQKFPDPEERDLSDSLFRFRDFLFFSSDSLFADPENGIASYVDVRNIRDWQLLLLLSNNNDGVKKNFYLYKTQADDLFRIAPWDYDHGYGRDGDNEYNLRSRRVNVKRAELIRRLMELDPDNYQRSLQDRWWELRAGIFHSDSLEARIDRMVSSFAGYIPQNRAIWPDNGPGYYDDRDFEAEVDLLRRYLRIRLEELDHVFCQRLTRIN